MIPKIIHQTWKTLDIPEQWKDAVELCKTINEEYKHIIYKTIKWNLLLVIHPKKMEF